MLKFERFRIFLLQFSADEAFLYIKILSRENQHSGEKDMQEFVITICISDSICKYSFYGRGI